MEEEKMDIVEPNPIPTMTFHPVNSVDEIGELSWNDGKFSFKGDAEASALAFFDYLKPLLDEYCQKILQSQDNRCQGCQ